MEKTETSGISTMIAPGTKVYELVEELAKFLPEEVREKFLDSDKNSF